MRAWGGNLHARSDHNFAPEWLGNGCYCQRGPWGYGWCDLLEPSKRKLAVALLDTVDDTAAECLHRHFNGHAPRREDDGAGGHQREQDQDRRSGEAGGS